MRVEKLLQAVQNFGKRQQIDPVQIVLFCDGSGQVMIPCPGHTAPFESACDFDTLAELSRFLEGGEVRDGGAR